MTTSFYKLTSPRVAGGAIYVSYRKGLLWGLNMADAQLSIEQIHWLLNLLPATEQALASTEMGTMKVELVPEKSAKDKLVLFCGFYQEYRGVPYTATQTERSNIRTVLVSRELLRVFFESPLLDFSIRNYIARINQTRDILKNGRDIKARFPREYDKAFYHSLTDPAQLMAKKLFKLIFFNDSSNIA